MNDIRKRLIENGVDPVVAVDSFKTVVKWRRNNFEAIRPYLSKREACKMEMSIIKDEFLLLLLRDACI